jgi:hypothetical protein
MTEAYSRIGGVATKDEAYRLAMHHIEELINQCLIIGHLHQTEDDNRSKLLAKGWYGIGNEMLPMLKEQFRQLAMGRIQ